MSRQRQLFIAIGLGIIGLLGLAVVARGQGAPGASVQQQYQQQLEKVDKDSPDELYELAKWCYQNGLVSEAMTHALEAHAKAPEDTRPKYLLYVLTGDTGESPEATIQEPGAPGTAAMSNAEADALFKDEGAEVMQKFKRIQSMLFARCGSSSCHGSQAAGNKWVLISRSPGARTTMAQNFRTLGPYINREDPPASRLLQIPMKAAESKHPRAAIRGVADPVYRDLLTWIDSLKTEGEKVWEREREKAKEKPTPDVSGR